MAALQRGRGDGEANYALTKARQEGIAGWGGRVDYGGAAGKLNWTVEQRRQRYAVAKHGGSNDERDAPLAGARK